MRHLHAPHPFYFLYMHPMIMNLLIGGLLALGALYVAQRNGIYIYIDKVDGGGYSLEIVHQPTELME